MSTFRAAKTICALKQWRVSNLPLQKLLYLSHLVHLGERGLPLASRDFEAWDLGPVEPSLYHKLKAYGSKDVPDIFFEEPYSADSPEYSSIASVLKQLGNASPGRLVAITHWKDGAWAKHYRQGVPGIRIPNGEVLKEYHRIVERSEQAKQPA